MKNLGFVWLVLIAAFVGGCFDFLGYFMRHDRDRSIGLAAGLLMQDRVGLLSSRLILVIVALCVWWAWQIYKHNNTPSVSSRPTTIPKSGSDLPPKDQDGDADR